MNQDLEHLRLLAIFHYVVAGMVALFACFPIIHFVIGAVMLFAPEVLERGAGPHGLPMNEMRFVGGFIMAFAGVAVVVGWSLAACVAMAGRNLVRRRHYTFCLVMAALLCLFVPFGTVLGVFTIIVLLRPSVKTLFEQPDGDPFATPPSAG